MWSVATEWQIYFVFALVLLPVLRRFGIVVTVITALVLGIVIDRCLPGSKFHYLSLFALGMCGALINFSPPGSKLHALENKVSWGWITIALITVFLGLSRHGVEWLEAHSTPGDLLIGLATVSFIVYCTAG